ncbi:hypothetical protein ACFOZ0_34885 [Streptomyces yaanensis]|uniref:Integral membrane protein n=1 Tax=Streptomyces yaanensis TaxID=1142239 RepID=A0ABV7SN51_9ACTN|nr:hypothetical protein [Streptomyces sp. CGMCC 4.7035]WNB97311.1 hypothetical protein Q2K21_04050 [Streptomyces sp. CGMCC 4.7035]
MPDRSLRLPPLLLRERHPSPVPPRESEDAPESGGGSASGGRGRDAAGGGRGQEAPTDNNPFAPPPEGAPDRPWQPRHPAPGQGQDQGQGGQEEGSGEGEHSPWGSQWSDRQPGPATGGRFGERPGSPGGQGGQGGQGGPEGPGGPGGNLRWDPKDPVQRRARYALLAGMWAFFFSLFSWPYVALLLGALALYWGTSALRAKPRTPDPNSPAPTGRPQTTAAISGLVTASLAIAMVAATFTAQLVYRDYYTCLNDALTNTAKQSCNDLLPKDLRGVLGTRG